LLLDNEFTSICEGGAEIGLSVLTGYPPLSVGLPRRGGVTG
jgi:hypothetical protein